MSARPILDKIVNTIPLFVYYKPHGVSLDKLDELILTLEEIEAFNLKDRQDLDQIGAAREMGISRSTFQRLLKSARKKVITAIIEGKAIKFEGGNYIPDKNIIRKKCLKGNYHYHIKREDLKEEKQEYKLSKIKCPKCSKRLVTFK
ncbi:MAG: hypothetical protein COT09_02185 [Candidatus Hydromicrobium americanum]|nr:MAG: hypothetical protein COT09_02185 [Candidatus Hydromicrobium americanum]